MCKIWGDKIPPVFVCLIYRPPRIPFDNDPTFIPNLRDFCAEYSHKIIMGDFNADLLTDNADSRFLNKLFAEISLKVVKHGPTHRPPGYTDPKTWIDFICVDSNDCIMNYNNIIPCFRNRHNLIDVQISLFIPKPPRNVFQFRQFNKIRPEDINEFLTSCEWKPFHTSEYNLDLNANVKSAVDQLAPLKTVVNPKKQKQPWVGTDLEFLLNKRKATEKRYHRTKDKRLLPEIIQLSEQIELLNESSRNTFLHDRLDDTITNGKNIWRELKHLGLLPRPKSELHGFSPTDLNNQFSSVSFSNTENSQEIENVISSALDEGFKFHDVTLDDIILAVAHFKTQATGTDGITHNVIAKSLPTIAPYLVLLFNESLKIGIFPQSWKTSLLVALKKVPIPKSPSDFRPIALLCFLSKVLEKLAHDQISLFLRKNKILDPMQTGFRQFSSTETALLKLTDDIKMGISKRLVTVLLQFDFSKAFDTVSPSKLLKKLKELGFSKSSLLWIKSYLENRQFQVASKTTYSETREVNLGVPQGSVLGPLLFCLYVNDIKENLSSGSFRLLYADDLQIYIQVPPECVNEAIETLSLEARKISTWANKVSLRLNPDKTKAIYFGSSTFIDRLDKLNLPGVNVSEGVVVPFVNEVKSLGIILDNKLSWEPHVISIEKKVNRVLYTLRFIRHCTTEILRKRLVQALVTPLLDYCSVVFLDARDKLRDRIQRLSNTCIRYIFGIRKDAHITPYRRKLSWLSMDVRRFYFSNILIYKILRIHQPQYLIDFFTKHIPKETARGPSLAKELTVTDTIKGRGSLSFQLLGVKYWNSLPTNIRCLPSLSCFKKSLYKYLLINNHRFPLTEPQF